MSSRSRRNQEQDKTRQTALYGISRSNDGRRSIRCRRYYECNNAYSFQPMDNCRDEESIAEGFRAQGWILEQGEKPICQACHIIAVGKVVDAQPPPPANVIELRPLTKPPVPTVTTMPQAAPIRPAPPPSPATRDDQTTRKIMKLFGRGFNDDANAYLEGWDDARVAREAGTSVALVARLREEEYGPFESAEFDAVRAEMKASEEKAERDLKAAVAELEATRAGVLTHVNAIFDKQHLKIERTLLEHSATIGTLMLRVDKLEKPPTPLSA
jgi:hypothetical protein